MPSAGLDLFLKSPHFKLRITEADSYAQEVGRNPWAVRVAWVSLTEGPLVARRYLKKRRAYQDTAPYQMYCRLIDEGIFSEDPQGVYYESDPKWEDDAGTMAWFNTIILIAEGMKVPEDFPRR